MFGLHMYASAWSASVSLAKYNLQSVRFATKKAGGSSRNGRDSPGQRLGVKKFGGHAGTSKHFNI